MESTQVQQAFLDAWNAHDLARIMAMVTDDCDFITADRRRFPAQPNLRAFFPTVWQRLPDAHWNVIAIIASVTAASASGFSPAPIQPATGSRRAGSIC